MIRFGKQNKLIIIFILALAIVAFLQSERIKNIIDNKEIVIGGPIPNNYKLKTTKNNVIGWITRPETGDVKYAYKGSLVGVSVPDRVANLTAGKSIVGEIINERTTHSRTFQLSNGEKVIDIIAGVPQYYRSPENVWWQVEYGTTTIQYFNQQMGISFLWFHIPIAYADTYYPDGTNYEDGSITSRESSWAAARDSVSAAIVEKDDAICTIARTGYGNVASKYDATRGFLQFNTSAIGAGSTISAASVSLYRYGTDNGDNDGDDFISVTATNPAADNSLGGTDFDQVKGTDGNFPLNSTLDIQEMHDAAQRKDIGTLTAGQYYVWTLNATGIGNINKSGTTKLGAAEGHDVLDNDYAGGSGTNNLFNIYCAEQAGTDKDPYLTVTYSAAASGWQFYQTD